MYAAHVVYCRYTLWGAQPPTFLRLRNRYRYIRLPTFLRLRKKMVHSRRYFLKVRFGV